MPIRKPRIILFSVALLIVLAAGLCAVGLWRRQTVAYRERRGDELAAAGSFEAATRMYAAAVTQFEHQSGASAAQEKVNPVVKIVRALAYGRDALSAGPDARKAERLASRRRAELMLKLSRTLVQTRSASLAEAYPKSERAMVLLREAFKLDPSVPGVAADLLDYHLRFALLLDSKESWKALLSQAEAAGQVLGSDPLVLKHRGIARSALAFADERPQEELAAAREDLAKALATRPDDWQLVESLAHTDLLLAEAMKGAGMPGRVEELRQSVRDLVRLPLSRHPESCEARISLLVALLDDGRMNPESADREQVAARLAELPPLLPQADAMQMRRLLRAMALADPADRQGPFSALNPRLSETAATLAAGHLSRHPDDVVAKLMLAGMLWAQARPDEATRFYRELADWDGTPTGIAGIREGFLVRVLSAESLGAILLDAAERTALAVPPPPPPDLSEIERLLDAHDRLAERAHAQFDSARLLRVRLCLLQRRPAAAAPLCAALVAGNAAPGAQAIWARAAPPRLGWRRRCASPG